ncbi:PVC-type heme-binding CxxCH protein [Prosthecobacter sp.]|uniref:PVC-type heme-binding CxxCH protein n=1 Tax=Prosthecobacter sp. TaxID=1965333 RepID=UPI001DEAAE84|nr:PVC-type heme-binding CxxCH protein [Prosthecobacter sp.]MCB1276748.1 HEAT repeat domain-containing protein [Prosthecobacter sp.]
MTRLHPLLFLTVATLASALTPQEMQQRFMPLAKDLPPMKNQPEPFSGVVKHPGLTATTWVRFPFVQNPGSFGIDRKGRLFVAEVNRFWQGVADLRGVNEFIRGDFQSRTLADREKLQNSIPGRFPEGFWTNTPDRLIRVEDSDGNGAADKRTVFADSFYEQLDGLGFSVLPEDDAVYFTCIPSLRKLTDTNDDGVADTNENLVTGFGVKISFIGHDLHGVVRGPDGRLYFSVGDRGYNVTTKEGEVVARPSEGAIFRCESDGSGFEVFCHGLRNPTELAFDEHGNLFTFDNTGDIGDKARLVYALEGTDSGWDMRHQSPHQYVDALDWEDFHPAKSMWVAERMYDTFNDAQPQWVYPPAAHVARGPSGVTWITGEAAPADLRGKFLLTDYGGAPQSCKVLALGVKPAGAGLTLASEEVLVEGVGASDVELGYDGSIYLCDFGGGWTVNANGAIHKITPTDKALQATAAEMAARFKRGVSEESVEQLMEALRSPDRRLRQMAQFELVKRGDAGKTALLAIAKDPAQKTTTRLNGVWGLGQLVRQQKSDATDALVELSRDADAQVRANAARVLGDAQGDAVRARLLEMLGDDDAQVRSLVAIALSRVAKRGDAEVIEALYKRVATNTGVDPVMRHSLLTALDRIGTAESAVAHAGDANREVRLMALLCLRRLASAELVRFLTDSDAAIRNEALRAIYDTAAVDTTAGEAVAAYAKVAELPPTIQRRVVAANYRLGTAKHAERLLALAADATLDLSTREAALQGLRMWEKRITADPVLGGYRPIKGEARSMKQLGGTIGEALKQFLAGNPPPKLAALELKLADDTGTVLAPATLITLVQNKKLQPAVRVAALESLVKTAPDQARAVVAAHLADAKPEVAAAALRQGLALKLDGIADAARKAIDAAPIPAARAGVEILAALQPAEALDRWTKRESNGLRSELWLDLFLALQSSTDTTAQQQAAAFSATAPDAVAKLSINGGDAKLGEVVFRNQGACLQCHKIGNDGGIQGPPLDLVGERLPREKLVESLWNPNAEIAAGYGLSSITLADGTLVAGRIAEESPERLTVIAMDGKPTTYALAQIKAVAPPVSAMPPMAMSLPPKSLRDLISFLATRNKSTAPKGSSADAHGEEKVAK